MSKDKRKITRKRFCRLLVCPGAGVSYQNYW